MIADFQIDKEYTIKFRDGIYKGTFSGITNKDDKDKHCFLINGGVIDNEELDIEGSMYFNLEEIEIMEGPLMV
jgi:hypothetical protein